MKMNIRKRDIASYLFLPGIFPRLRAFSKDGFSILAVIVASIYNAVGLLPKRHEFLQPNMVGQFGITDVILEARRHLKFDLKHIDQIIIFLALFLGLILLAIQFVVILISFIIKTAEAGGLPVNFSQLFSTTAPNEDIAFRLLDMVFGIPGFFGSSELTFLNYFANFHVALHGMYVLYSTAILVIAVVIVSYFVIAVILETAQTGTPFGRRFEAVWVPVRLIIAFGLLVPIGYGMNSGQYISLYAAKWGSGLATNGWIHMNSVLANGGGTYLGNRRDLVARPGNPDPTHLQSFAGLMMACDSIYESEPYNYDEIEAYIVRGNGDTSMRLPFWTTPFEVARLFGDGEKIHVKIGHFDTTYTKEKGYVKPICGEMYIDTISVTEPGLALMQQGYYHLAQTIVYGQSFRSPCGPEPFLVATQAIGDYMAGTYMPDPWYTIAELEVAMADLQPLVQSEYNSIVNTINACVSRSQNALAASPVWNVSADGLRMGWAGAAIWYNRIARVNGAFVSTVQSVPRVSKYPEIMEYVLSQKMQQDANVNASSRFEPTLEEGRKMQFGRETDADTAAVFNRIFTFWEDQGYGSTTLRGHADRTGNVFMDTINAIFGTQGLFDMCANPNVHPVAQLSSLGKGLIEASIRNLGYSLASGVLGGAAYILEVPFGPALDSASGFFSAIAGITMLIGFMLFYIMPFLPFLYFFFAVGGWVKGLFEAMVGVPLWALAHLRIDGEGLPGQNATYGYFLILEIFLRPIMIIMGLLASITIYSASVKVLNDAYFLAVSNLSGQDPLNKTGCAISGSTNLSDGSALDSFVRGPIDEFFFTVMYAIIVYIMGMASFKLIDEIPNQISRWMGKEVETFNDKRSEAAEGLMSRVAIGGGAISGQLSGAISQGKSAIGSGISGIGGLIR